MHSITFYPVGNGDTSLIETNGKLILMDFYQNSSATEDLTPEYDIVKTLHNKLEKAQRNSFDVVVFTHADKDHIQGSSDFFYLEHAIKYQSESRIKIDELWVPAAMLLESVTRDELSAEFVIWRNEARHRLQNKKGIKVFSKPEELLTLINKWGMTEVELSTFLIEAGTVLPNFSLECDGIEFFVHSPFRAYSDENIDNIKSVRNETAIIFNIRFKIDDEVFDYLAVGDSVAKVLEDIVQITKYYNRQDRLAWDLFNIPHHCSYLALAEQGNKGEKETEPTDKVKELLRMGKKNSYIICSSNAFKSDEEAEASIQPPHIQARRSYEKYLKEVGGRKFIVTGEHGSIKNPTPIVIHIKNSGLIIDSGDTPAVFSTGSSKPARAG